MMPPSHKADPVAARLLFLKAAEGGDVDAAVAAGEMLINGRGGPADPVAAMALFQRAKAAGHPAAIHALNILAATASGGGP